MPKKLQTSVTSNIDGFHRFILHKVVLQRS